jgi:hypothetical protein
LVDELVPCITAVVDEIVVGFEDAVGEPMSTTVTDTDRLAELMCDLFGVSMVPATIARMSRSCAHRLQPTPPLHG